MRLVFLAGFLIFCCAVGFCKDANPFSMKINRGIRIGKQEESTPKPEAAKKTKPAPAPKEEAPPAMPAFSFEGESYILSNTSKPAKGPLINEYYRPQDNNPAAWQKLIGVYYYENSKSGPLEAAQAMIDVLKTSNPEAGYGVIQNEKTGDIIIDYFIWTEGNQIIEFNAFKISKYKGKPIALQFSARWYEDEQDFLDNIKTLRAAWLEAITAAAIPLPHRTEK